MDIQSAVERHETAIKALRMLQDIERIKPQCAEDAILKAFILERGTEGAAVKVNAIGLRMPGKTAAGPRRYISTDITAIVAATSDEKADERLVFLAKGLYAMKRHRKSWQSKLESLCDEYVKRYGKE